MTTLQNIDHGMQSVGNGAAVGSFIQTYRYDLPDSTLKVLQDGSKGMVNLGTQQLKH